MITNEPYLFILIVFLSVSAIVSTEATRTGNSKYEHGFVAQNEEVFDEEDYDLPVETAANVGNISIILKAPDDCQTPAGNMGYCIAIKQCPVLLDQINNPNASEFLKHSKCDSDNNDPTNPFVCCGKNANFSRTPKKQMTNTKLTVNSAQYYPAEHNKVLPRDCGHQKINLQGRIFGGKQASLGEFPWMARLLHRDSEGERHFGCSGFLIHSRYVLTAGHCTHKKFIVKRGPVFSVVLGEHNINTELDCVKGICADPLNIRKVAEVIVHPDYDPYHENAHYNDITLIRLKNGAKISDYVKPICLNRDPTYNPTEYILSGWGKTENETVSSVKMKVSLPPVNRTECDDQYSILNVTLRETQICAGGEEGKDSCNGDSGGPLMFFGDNNSWFAAGIVSFGIGCGSEGWPGVYTNVANYIPWIQKIIHDRRTKSQRKTKTPSSRRM